MKLLLCLLVFSMNLTFTIAARCGLHAKPLDGPPEEPADLTAERFWEEYVRKMRPVIIRGAVKDDLGKQRWTSDEYVLKNYGHMKVRMEAKDEGSSKSNEAPVVDTIKNFYEKWIDGAYTVTQLPGGMNNESTIVPCMACGPIRDQFIEANLWISNGDTNSKIHKDSNNQMNCLYVGKKEWSLFAPEQGPNLYLVNERPGADQTYDTAGFSRISTRNVDLKRFPKLEKVPFMKAVVNPGDCIYVPGTYIHHVYSSGERNIQVSMLFSANHIPTSMPRVHKKTTAGPSYKQAPTTMACDANGRTKAPLISDVDVAWPYDGVGPITMGFAVPDHYIGEWKELLAKPKYKEGLTRGEFSKFIGNWVKTTQDACDDRGSDFSADTETRRHVYDGLAVLWPDRTPKDWNETCTAGECKIPNICTILQDKIEEQAAVYHDQIAGKDGKLKVAHFAGRSRREVQNAMTGPYVQDQVVSIFKGWTGGDNEDGYQVGEGGDGADDDDGGDDEEEGGSGKDEM